MLKTKYMASSDGINYVKVVKLPIKYKIKNISKKQFLILVKKFHSFFN
jgi:hypothetical protein